MLNHFDIFGIDSNNEHSENKPYIFFTLSIFHLDISGKDINDLQLENRKLISIIILSVFHKDISGNNLIE